jgi:hypothetical protein
MTELSLTERMLLAHIDAAPAAPESYRGYITDPEQTRAWLGNLDQQPVTVDVGEPAPCPSRSHGANGWHCAITGEHIAHVNAARTVAW